MYDFTVIGGGIVGISTAYHLVRVYPKAKIVVLEKEKELGLHQTGNNSGVIHSGIYYKPGSLKARFATEGNKRMFDFIREHGIPYERCGKVIVATKEEELPLLHDLYERGRENGLDIRNISKEELREIEPHVRGLRAIHVPSTGIVDFKQVLNVFAHIAEEKGVEIRLSSKVEGIGENREYSEIQTNTGTIRTRFMINCAGLFSDRILRMANIPHEMKIIPFRGEYYELKSEKSFLIKNLIYPVPNPAFPFLGVHFTRMINGTIHVGPNAVLGLKREGYRKTDISLRDSIDILTYPAFWKIAGKHLSMGIGEMVRSFSKHAFVKNVQRFIPEIRSDDLVSAPAGVRAQALAKDGRLVDDFFISKSARSLHVCNAPSPAATASLIIGEYIVELIKKQHDEKESLNTKLV